MSRLTELLADLEKEFSQGNRLERELSRADVDTSDLIKNDPLLLEGLFTAGTLPIAGASAAKFAISNRQLPSWLAPFTSRSRGNEIGLLKTREPFLPETSRKIKDYAERQKLADQKMMFQQKKLRNEIKNNRTPTRTELGLEPKQLELTLQRGGGKEPLTSKYRVNQKPITNLDIYPNKLDRIINRRPANPLERTEIEELTKRGFYGPTPKSPPPVRRDPPGYGQSDEAIPPLEIERRVRQAQQLQKLNDERSFLNTQASRINSMRQQGEATQKDMNQLEEIRRRIAELDELLK